MSDDLRTRIAVALASTYGKKQSWEEMADVLIRELKLNQQQWTWSWERENGELDYGYPVDTRAEAVEESGRSYRIVHRYVTEWEADV